jgi:GntR family transcriptional regulator, transcriptional repressor for pyruvate dehydrogenase complex
MIQANNLGLAIEPIEQKTMTELVSKRLIHLISSGALKGGDKIPPERDLAMQLNVGRTTLREALKLLTLSGVLEAKRGDGTYVRAEFIDLLSQQLAWPVLLGTRDLDMLLEVRLPLEVQSARLAAERCNEEDLKRIRGFEKLLEIRGRDIQKETDLDLEFHQAIADASRNKLLCQLMQSLHGILRQYIMLSNEATDRVETTVAEHQAVYDAIAARDSDTAEHAMKEHLRLSKMWITTAFSRESKDSHHGTISEHFVSQSAM